MHERTYTPGLIRRLWRWAVALTLMGGVVGAGAWGLEWVLAPANLPMELVRIEGEIRHTRKEELERTLAESLRGGFFSVDLPAVREAVEALPWVSRASLRRIWPGTLAVRVEERSALARWGEAAVISPEGEVFVPEAASIPPDLPRLDGPEGSASRVLERYGQVRRRLEADGLGLARLSLNERGAWVLELKDGPIVLLGNRGAEERLERLLAQYGGLTEKGLPEQVDLRYANGFAVRWRPTPDPKSTRVEG